LKAIASALRAEAGELGYPNTAEANEATAAQIPAQNPSDKSDITTKDAPVPKRRAGSRFSTSRSADFRSLTEKVCGETLLGSTSASLIWRASIPLTDSKRATHHSYP
jgi:hypothetical protein